MSRVTLDELLKEVGVSLTQLDKACTSEHLQDIALFLPSWRIVASHLSLSDVDVEGVEMEGRSESEKRLKVLKVWKDRSAFKATYTELVKVFLKIGNADQAMKVCRLLVPQQANEELHDQRQLSTTSVASEPKPLSSANPLSSIDVSGPTPERHVALRKKIQKELKPESPKMEEVSRNRFHAPVLERSTTNVATMALSKDSRCPNGVPRTCKVPRSAAGFRLASGFVAAIDFGTTCCSVAYTLQQDSKEILKLQMDGANTRVPNAILIDKKTTTVEAFGFRAQTIFSRMKFREKYIFFEPTKMKQDVSRTTPISPINSDEEYYLVDVVAIILKYLRDILYDSLRTGGLDMSKIQFDWVVTVPAIWDNRGKQMMREAAYKAGLCSSLPSCKLIPYCKFQKLERPVENSPDKLSLALGPELAALFCHTSGHRHSNSRHFTVLDIGGSTADSTSYHIDDGGHLCVTDRASSNGCEGQRVNEQFRKFLLTVVNDPDFREYLHVPDVQLRQWHRADLNRLIYECFEQQKMFFGDEDNDDKRLPAVIDIPNSFGKFYMQEKLEKSINAKYRNVAELDGLELIIEPQKMKEFFQPSVDQISHYALLALENVIHREVGKLEASIYLVGGFGGCKFIKKALQDIIQRQYGHQVEVCVPIDHKFTVAYGAIKFRRNPEIIWARKAEVTFGYIVNSPFDPDIHDPAYKLKNEEGKDYCRDLFQPFIEIGDTINADEVLQNSVTPFKRSTTHMAVTVYSSRVRDIWYTTDKDGKLIPELNEVGKLVFDLEDIPGKSRSDKSVVLTIDLSQTEIHLKAHHEKTGKEVKVVLDCP